MRSNFSAPPLVMRGLDPRIHLLHEMSFFKRWIAGSSPAMTPPELVRFIALPIDVPSPLVGEGITAARPKLDWVRGSLGDDAMRRQPLTRLRFAQPPSPTGGEGKKRGQSA
jgi:hypothetical protein